MDASALAQGLNTLAALFQSGQMATDEIRIAIGERAEPERPPRDQNDALEAWPERGLLGSQMGPNKNGKKW